MWKKSVADVTNLREGIGAGSEWRRAFDEEARHDFCEGCIGDLVGGSDWSDSWGLRESVEELLVELEV